MTIFSEKVYAITRLIPRGKVITYAQLAALANKKGAARAVGMLMHNNPDMTNIPCYRVVASDGSLRGPNQWHNRELLIREGVKFKKNRVDLKLSQWHPTNIVETINPELFK